MLTQPHQHRVMQLLPHPDRLPITQSTPASHATAKAHGLSNRLVCQALCIAGSHVEPCLAMALSIVSSLRMQATRATFLRLPLASRRW